MEAEGNFIPAQTLRKSDQREERRADVRKQQPGISIRAGDNFNLPALNFTQFLSPYFGLTIDKDANLTSDSSDMNEFAHGKGDSEHMNSARNFNLVILPTVAYFESLYGNLCLL